MTNITWYNKLPERAPLCRAAAGERDLTLCLSVTLGDGPDETFHQGPEDQRLACHWTPAGPTQTQEMTLSRVVLLEDQRGCSWLGTMAKCDNQLRVDTIGWGCDEAHLCLSYFSQTPPVRGQGPPPSPHPVRGLCMEATFPGYLCPSWVDRWERLGVLFHI